MQGNVTTTHRFDVWYYIGIATFVGMLISAIGTIGFIIFRKKNNNATNPCKIKVNRFSLTGSLNEEGECEIFNLNEFI